jgi:hypothetical protein
MTVTVSKESPDTRIGNKSVAVLQCLASEGLRMMILLSFLYNIADIQKNQRVVGNAPRLETSVSQ